MRKHIRVRFKASDFRDTHYLKCTDCALTRALKRKYPQQKVVVGGVTANVGLLKNYFFSFDQYNAAVFNKLQRTMRNKKKVALTLTLFQK